MSRVLDLWTGMTGTVLPFAGAAAPAGWLMCHGQAVSRATYAGLFAVIGTTYGAGDGATTFAVPDLRGEFIRGVDGGKGIDPGRTLGSTQRATPMVYDATSSDPTVDAIRGTPATVPGDPINQADYGGVGIAHSWTNDNITVAAEVSPLIGVHPRSLALHHIIKT